MKARRCSLLREEPVIVEDDFTAFHLERSETRLPLGATIAMASKSSNTLGLSRIWWAARPSAPRYAVALGRSPCRGGAHEVPGKWGTEPPAKPVRWGLKAGRL